MLVWMRGVNIIMMCCLLGNSSALAGTVAEYDRHGVQRDPVPVVTRMPSDPLDKDQVWADDFPAQNLGQDLPLLFVADQAAVAFSPSAAVDVFAGYCFPDEDVARRDLRADTEFEGPYVGALIRF